MSRSVFFATLAMLLAGAHTAGPEGPAGLPQARPRNEPAHRCDESPQPAAGACA